MVGPNYKPPEVHVNPSYGELSAQMPATQPTTRASVVTQQPVPAGKWWTTFNDDELNSLIDRAVKGNLSVQEAQSRLRQARYQLAIAGAQLYPDVNVDGGYNHSRGSSNIIIPPGAFGSSSSSSATPLAVPRGTGHATAAPAAVSQSGTSGSGSGGSGGGSSISGGGIAGPQSPLGQGGLPGVVTDVYQVGFDASWEIDVFGGTRRGIEAAEADTQAAIEDERSVYISLLAEVARNYVELRGFQRQAEIARQNLLTQEDSLELTRSRFQNGFVTQLDVSRQAAQVATTAAEIPPLEYQAHQSIHSLSILLGLDPDALAEELEQVKPIPPLPPTVPVGLPSDLLRRRPDIRRAERQLAASSARIGVATADLFPKFTITGLLGLDSSKPKNLFDYSSRYYSFVPGVSWPIFDAGQIQNNIKVQNELERQAALGYQNTVLSALQEVEDSLAAYRTEQVRRRALADAVAASRDAVDLARQQYQQGVTDFLTVLDAQRTLLSAENSLVQSDSNLCDDLVALYKALGGGWEVEGKS
jgi:NodT family efflux transporter outer membrane factor (OMF) lipoprotein